MLCCFTARIKAQNSIQNLLELQLPPLDTLFRGASKSSMVQFYDYRMEGQELILKTEKRKWLEYFSLAGSYQYGVIAISSFMDIGENYPLIYQYSGSEQGFYNIGASFRLPLDRLFDRRNRIKQQKLKIKETLEEREMWYDEQKMKIIELYTKAQEMLNNLQSVIEYKSLAESQYEIAQNDYVNGATTAQALNSAKGAHVQSVMQYERLLAELQSSLLKLEILSNTKILNK